SYVIFFIFFSSRRRHTRFSRDWSSDVCSSDLDKGAIVQGTVKSVEPKGAVVTLSVDVEGYLRASEISSGRVEDATTVLNAGDNRSEERRVGKERRINR